MLKPCQNNGNCTNDNTTVYGYNCACPRGFDGAQCQVDNRPCKPNTCWNNGISSFFILSQIYMSLIFFKVYVMKHRAQHLNVHVKMVGQVVIVKKK
jgi:hypothetical protein